MTDMQTLTDAERAFAANEHRELAAGINDIERLAQSIGCSSPAFVTEDLVRVREWVACVLVPHAAWEEAVLYAEMDERAGTAWATRLMRFEHQQITTAAARLESDAVSAQSVMNHDQTCALRSHLTALATLLRSHMEREDRFLLPLLAAT